MIPCSSFIELSFVSEPINCFKWLVAQVLLDNFVSSFLLRDDGSRHSRHRICLNRNVTKFGLLHQNVVVGVNATTAEVFGPKIKIQLFNRCLSFWVVLSIALDCKVFEMYCRLQSIWEIFFTELRSGTIPYICNLIIFATETCCW